MSELFEILLVDSGQRWHAGWLVDDETETDVLLAERGRVLLFASRAALEHYAQEHAFDLDDDLPDEVDLSLGGWLAGHDTPPTLAEVSELWHLLIDDPAAGRHLVGEDLGEAYDDMVEELPGWFDEHGPASRIALGKAVESLRGTFTHV